MIKRALLPILTITAALFSPLAANPKPDTAIFLNTLPESAQYYLVKQLADFYKLQTFMVSKKTFPTDAINERTFTTFVQGKDDYITPASLPPTKYNINLLNAQLGKMVLHVRDPRDALVSWIEYTERHRNHPMTLGLISPVPPAEYFGWSYSKKADWQINNFYTYSVKWLEEWTAFLTSNPQLQVLVTHFEEVATDPLHAFREIVAFYGTDPELLTEKQINALTKLQYNTDASEIGMWRNKLTPEQQQKITSMLPDQVAQFFSIEKN